MSSEARVNITATDRTRAAFESVQRRMGLTEANARALALGVTGVTVALTAMTKRAIESADRVAKLSRQVGLNAETFQAWEFAASQAGVSTEKFRSSVERASKRIGEAAAGYGAAKNTLEALGIEVVDVDGRVRSTESVLRDFSRALAEMTTAEERAAAAAAVLGREGIGAALLFSQGEAALDRYEQQARELGLVLGEDVLRGAEDAADKLDQLERVVSVQATKALSELFPVVVSIGNAFVAATPHVVSFFNAFQSESIDRIDNRIEMVRTRIGELQEVLEGGQVPAVQILGRTVISRQSRDSDVGPAIRELEALEDVLEALEARRAEALSVPTADLIDPASLIPPTALPSGAAGAGAGEGPRGTDGLVEGTRAVAFERELEMVRQASLSRVEVEREAFAMQVMTAKEALDRQLISREEYQTVVEGLASNHAERLLAIHQTQEQAKLDTSVTTSTEIARTAENVIFAGFERGADGMVDVFARSLQRMLAELARSQLQQALSGIFPSGGGTPGIAGGGGGGLFASALGAFGGLLGFNTGGEFVVPPVGGTDTVVPLFRASAGEKVTITPRGGAQGGERGASVQQTISIDARGADVTVLPRIEDALERNRKVTEASIVRMLRKGRIRS